MTLVKPSSEIFSGGLPHRLSSDVRQVVIFVIRLMISPHHKNNLEPLCSESSKRLMVAMAFSSLSAVIPVRPFTSLTRIKRKPVHRIAQMLLTGVSKLDHTAFAAGFSHGHFPRLSLKMPEGVPSIFHIAQLSPNHRYGGPAFSTRQRLGNFSCRHIGEKTFDFLGVTVYRFNRDLQLNDKRQQQFCFGSDHVFRNTDLRLIDLLPELLATRLAQVMVGFGKTLPPSARHVRELLRGRIRFEKIQRDVGFQILKDFQRTRVILFKRYPHLIEKPRFLPQKSLVVPSEHLELLHLGGVGLESSQMRVIGSQKLRQHISIKRITLRLTHAKPIPRSIQRLGIHRIHHDTVIEKKIHNSPLRLLDGRPKLNSVAPALIEPVPELSQLFGCFLDLSLFYFSSVLISHIQLMAFVSPIHTQIIALQISHPPVLSIANSTSYERKVRLISVLGGTTFYKTLAPFFCWSGQSVLDPRKGVRF